MSRYPHSDPLSTSVVLFIIVSSKLGLPVLYCFISLWKLLPFLFRVKLVKIESCDSPSEAQQTFRKLLLTRNYHVRLWTKYHGSYKTFSNIIISLCPWLDIGTFVFHDFPERKLVSRLRTATAWDLWSVSSIAFQLTNCDQKSLK